jgi:glycosyltransferase involved in cell wall biosynthesis
MKRVCIVRQRDYPQHLHVCRDAETLAAHGYEVDVICCINSGQKKQEVTNGVTIYRLPLEYHRRGILWYLFEYCAFFFLAFWKLTWLSLKKRYNVIEVDNLPDFLVFVSLVPKLLGAKVILYFFELMPEVFAEQFNVGPNHLMVKLLCWVEKASAYWADHIITANGVCQQEVLKNRGIPARKMSVVLNVAHDDAFSLSSSPENNNGNFYVITHGSLLKRYGVQTLIRAAFLLKEEIPQLEVKVLGAGEYRQTLEELAKSLDVEDRVHFTGWVPFEEMLSLLTKAHLCIVALLPQKQPQMPVKLFEYLCLGKPTVTTALPAVKAYLDDNSVMYYEPDDEHDLARCILELYKNPEKRAMLAASGSATYQKYRWSVMKNDYLSIYEKLAGLRD